MHVIVRRMVLGGEGHKYVGVRRYNRSRITIRKIDAAVGQSYVVNNALDLRCRNLLSNRPLDLIAQVSRFFDAHSGWSPHMQFESAAIYAGKEVPSQPGNQNRRRTQTTRKEHNQENSAVMGTHFQ